MDNKDYSDCASPIGPIKAGEGSKIAWMTFYTLQALSLIFYIDLTLMSAMLMKCGT